MSPKLLIVLVVLLILLFVLGIGMGAFGNKGPGINFNQPWVESLGNLLQPHMGIGDVGTLTPPPTVSPGCLINQPPGGFTVPVGTICTFSIRSSSTDVRKIILHRIEPSAIVTVTLFQPAPFPGPTTITTAAPTPNGNSDFVLAVYKDGGTLSISCISNGLSPNCTFRLT
jgi:hypothetical protein